MAAISVGNTFDSYDEFYKALIDHGRESKVQWVKRDSKTIENGNKLLRPGEQPFDQRFVYKYARFRCKYSGEYRKTGLDVRPNQRTFKMSCPSEVYVAVDRILDKLVVQRVNVKHNHPLEGQLFVEHPEQRQLVDPCTIEEVKTMLRKRVNIKEVKEFIRNQGYSWIRTSDIHNIRQKIRKGSAGDPPHEMFLLGNLHNTDCSRLHVGLPHLQDKRVTQNISSLSLKIGDEFSSFQKAATAIQGLEEEQGEQFWIKDSHTLKSANGLVKVEMNQDLIYFEVHWACVRGWRDLCIKSSGHRDSQHSGRCKAFVKMQVREDGQRLMVTSAFLVHNHSADTESASQKEEEACTTLPLQPLSQVRPHHREEVSSEQEMERVSRGTLRAGQEFSSYEELRHAIRSYEETNFINLFSDSSRTIQSGRRRANKWRMFNKQLRVSEVTLSCVHGQRRQKSRSTGLRQPQGIYRTGCPFKVEVRLSSDGSRLVVAAMVDRHNHPCSLEVFKRMPRQRRLTSQEQEEALELLKGETSRRVVLHRMKEATGKPITMKDIHNLASKARLLQHLLAKLSAVPGSTMEGISVAPEAGAGLGAVYFQTAEMKKVFSSYPELVVVVIVEPPGGTSALRPCVIALVVLTGNGKGEVTCLWVAGQVDHYILSSLLRTFKQHNPASSSLEYVMGRRQDHALAEAVCREFPYASYSLSPYHVLDEVRLELEEKVVDGEVGRRVYMEAAAEMVFAQSPEEHEEACNRLQEADSQGLLERLWRTAWPGPAFLGQTDLNLSEIICNLRTVVTEEASPSTLASNLLERVCCLKLDQDYQASKVALPTQPQAGPTQAKYSALLTPYALRFLKKQLRLSMEVQVLQVDDSYCRVAGVPGDLKVRTDGCSCSFLPVMKLPCCHILAVLHYKGESAFTPQLCADRWKLRHFWEHQTSLSPEHCKWLPNNSGKRRKISHEQRLYKNTKVAKNLAEYATSAITHEESEAKFSVLQELERLWGCGSAVPVL